MTSGRMERTYGILKGRPIDLNRNCVEQLENGEWKHRWCYPEELKAFKNDPNKWTPAVQAELHRKSEQDKADIRAEGKAALKGFLIALGVCFGFAVLYWRFFLRLGPRPRVTQPATYKKSIKGLAKLLKKR